MFLATGSSSEVQSAVVIQNSPVTADGGSYVSASEWKAILFTSGASAGVVDSITLGLNPPSGTSLPASLAVRVSLYSMVSGIPSIALDTSDLVPIEMSALRQTYALPNTVEFSLQPLTPYALVVSSDATGIRWGTQVGVAPVASDGFLYNGFLASSDSGSTWVVPPGTANVLLLGFTAVPEPQWGSTMVGAVLLVGAGTLIHRRRTHRSLRSGEAE